MTDIFLMKFYTAEKTNPSELHVSTWISLNTKFGKKKKKKPAWSFCLRLKNKEQSCMLSMDKQI